MDTQQDFGNYIQTANPFQLAAPPASFLRDLHAYDDRLVIFASMAEPVYRLCRKVSGAMPWHKFPPGHADNATMFGNKMIPLKALFPNPQWGQVIINALACCDVQRVGGGTAAAELLDQSEELEERRLDAAIADEAGVRATSAYGIIKRQSGETVIGGVKNHEGGRAKNLFGKPKAPRRTYRPRGTGDHAIFVGR